MNLRPKHAIGFLAALIVMAFFSVALIYHFSDHHTLQKAILWGFSAFSILAGVTVTYTYPVTSPALGTTPPTLSQVKEISDVSATVNFADSDTTFTVTHNYGDPGYGPTDTSQGFPIPIYWYTSAGTGPVQMQVVLDNAKAVFTKASSAGSGGTMQVHILRPNTRFR